jgi:glycosyltransferase involved in cell wall biosynthesis
LNKNGVEAKVFSFSLQYPSFLFPGKTQYASDPPPEQITILPIINSINPFSWIKAAKMINKESPDFVIIRFWLPFMGPCLGSIARMIKKGIKIIAITDNVLPHEKRPGDRLFTRYFVNACHGFVAMSSSVLDDLKQFTHNPNTCFLPHPIYDIFGTKVSKKEALERLGLDPADNHILFFGFIRKYKGLDLLLSAMGDKRLKEANVKLIIAGEYYQDREYYETIINKNQLTDQIILRTDYIPSDEVKYYFCAADLVAQPYRSATQSGITQIAYHFERPMLVTNMGGLPEIVPNGKVGYVVEPQPEAIADAISRFYLDNMEDEFTVNVKEGKKRFVWSTFVEGLVTLVKSL